MGYFSFIYLETVSQDLFLTKNVLHFQPSNHSRALYHMCDSEIILLLKHYINKEPTLSTLNIFVYFRHHQIIY